MKLAGSANWKILPEFCSKTSLKRNTNYLKLVNDDGDDNDNTRFYEYTFYHKFTFICYRHSSRHQILNILR
jgi:hypothetical protein